MPQLGKLTVSRQGFGSMGLSHNYGRADDANSLKTLHRALDLGITFFDTATGYGKGHNESLLGKAFADRRDAVTIASKFIHRADGAVVTPREAVEASLARLGVDHIDLYYLHRVDADIPIEESIGGLGELVKEGKIGAVGVSEASAEQVRRGHAAFPLTALQSEYSLWTRDVEVEILPTVRELGIGFVAYSPLGRGFLAGAEVVEADDVRNQHPRFQADAIAANTKRREAIERIAARLGVSKAQVALAWVLSKDVVPIPGTRHIEHLEANWAANDLLLDQATIAELETAYTRGSTFGTRYPANRLSQVPPEPAAEAALA
ncbi:aryl-alcohol dehydrogenase-like predicted oxidoreductase [Sphingopyxis panaciterrae]|uniref:aldo/keto reductase n=1 Tax=Sphingopyxis panaciterrae TaxID=363841 RepID=UPI0014228CB3|nr:aldo/keto reductase [Sphingopyxis panaciterrae]NIJ37364.1 aryl-alcohol dehydrogenase-like predicted oxidoreductase [Sphingopyxis panaciterrae]